MSDVLLEPSVAVFAPVGRAGGRRPPTLSTGPAIPPGGLAPGQRWSVGRKREVVLRLLRGESTESLSRELGVPLYRLERWHERVYRTRFFGHKFELSGLLHSGFLPGDTCVVRTA